jgi:hypothetical protein
MWFQQARVDEVPGLVSGKLDHNRSDIRFRSTLLQQHRLFAPSSLIQTGCGRCRKTVLPTVLWLGLGAFEQRDDGLLDFTFTHFARSDLVWPLVDNSLPFRCGNGHAAPPEQQRSRRCGGV